LLLSLFLVALAMLVQLAAQDKSDPTPTEVFAFMSSSDEGGRDHWKHVSDQNTCQLAWLVKYRHYSAPG
jgi:hypothetical protein